MNRKEKSGKLLAVLMALSVMAGSAGMLSGGKADVKASAAETDPRITVDINSNDGRKASYARWVDDNWIITGQSSESRTVNGVTFKLSNGGSSGGNLRSINCEALQEMSGIYPYLAMDGVTIADTSKGGVIKLEISGLSAGTHSLKMWHSCVDDASVGTLSVSVNGKTTATGVACPTRVKDEDNTGISYSTFEVSSGQTATVLIKPEGNGNAWLNGFELDGGDPINGISCITPEDTDSHHDKTTPLSWKAGKNAKSHNVYIGTDETSVYNATTSSKEFKGNQTGTSFALDDSYQSIYTYYWRVDTIDNSGNVIKGSVNSFQVNRLAFPTAEGYGRHARGGQGGQVIHVTNLNDSGEGSLRWALCDSKWQTADWKGVPRIIVFDVGGVIELKSRLSIPDNAGNVYVAGQTAPGDGITVINFDFGASGTKDLIIRDVRTRVGDYAGKSMGGMGLGSCDYCIMDHCSISWATDEGFSSRQAKNITFQWNIIGESLHDSVHYDGTNRDETETHAFAASISGYTGSFHHNLLIDCTGRNWSLAGSMEQDVIRYGGQLDIRNNVVYNWMDRTTDGGVRRLNFVNNYYKAGPVSNTNMHIVSMDGNELNTSDMQKMYVSGNVMVDTSGNYLLKSTDNAWDKGKAKSGRKNSTDADVRSDTPFFESYVETESADNAYKSVIASVGAGGTSDTGWDYIDSRYIKEVTNTTYTYKGSKQGLKGIIDSQNDAGGYPNSSNFAHSTDGMCNSKNDTDRDGMPNVWEEAHGLNPNDASDGAVCTLSADGYTNVEMFLNELMGDPVVYNGNGGQTIDNGILIKELKPFSAAYYNDWSIDTNLELGDMVFGDRDVYYSSIPDHLVGAEYILTPCDAKGVSSDLASFTAGADMTVYIGQDSRLTTAPGWLSGWTKTSDTLVNNKDVSFVLYSKEVKEGETVTLGTNGQSSGCVNYVVLASAKEAGSDKGVRGDVNADGIFTLADIVMMQKYLVCTASLNSVLSGDMNSDGRLNIFDLNIMKKEKQGNSNANPSEKSYSLQILSSLFNQSNTDTLGLSAPAGLETVTVWKAEDEGDHYCNGVCLAGFKGKLYCQWQSSATDEDSADTHVKYAVSEDGGKTWSEPMVLAQNIGDGYCSSGGWLATDNQLVAYINFWDNNLSTRGGFTYYMTSTDGTNWSQPKQVTMADGTPMAAIFEQDPHVLQSGRIVNSAHFQDGLIISPIYTDDPMGISGWKKGDFTPTVSGTTSREMEPSLFVQSDGTIVMTFRDQNSSYKKLVSYSLDDGETWSEVLSTDIPDARTKQSAGNLSDGTAFLAGSPVNNSLRAPLAVALSADGKNFNKAYLLRSNSSDPEVVYEGKAKRKGFHYCKSLVYNGNLYVGYATNKEAVEISIVPEASLMLN